MLLTAVAKHNMRFRDKELLPYYMDSDGVADYWEVEALPDAKQAQVSGAFCFADV